MASVKRGIQSGKEEGIGITMTSGEDQSQTRAQAGRRGPAKALTAAKLIPERGPLLTAAEVAELLLIHKDEVYRMGAAGELPCISVGRRRTRFPRTWILKYLEEQARGQGVDVEFWGDAI